MMERRGHEQIKEKDEDILMFVIIYLFDLKNIKLFLKDL